MNAPDQDAETVAVEDLRPGDYVDLENDYYADPFGNRGEERCPADGLSEADHMYYECEYAVVAEPPVRETDDCTVVHFNDSTVGFPRGHQVQRFGNDGEGPGIAGN